jgi:DNA repair exonuclease SbcCD ATPase subunit
MQEHELYMKMELEKKEVRFKQLEKEVKSRLRADPFPTNAPLLPSPAPDNEEIDYLQEELDKVRNSYRELERDNLKLKKKLEKTQSLEGEKKKLEKIILDVSKTKDTEIEMLLVSLYDLRSENIKIHQLLSRQS